MADDLTADDVRERLRAACEAAGSQLAWARENKVTAAYVSDVLKGRRDPGESILRRLGLVRVTIYRDAGASGVSSETPMTGARMKEGKGDAEV